MGNGQYKRYRAGERWRYGGVPHPGYRGATLRSPNFAKEVKQYMANWISANLNVTPKVPDQTVIFHISDLHFTSTTDWRKGSFSALLADVARGAPKPDIIACTGDVVDSSVSDTIFGGNVKAMSLARDFLLQAIATLVM